jgi:uncharacterized cupredoxin-like copper-binding protein
VAPPVFAVASRRDWGASDDEREAMTRISANVFLASLFVLTVGGILVGACSPKAEAVPLDLVMVDYRFVPDHLTFQHDVHYRLHLENRGKETHEMTAPTFFATAKIDNPDVLNRERTEILMQPGDVKDLFLTPGKPGTYDLRCSDHDWDGMVGGITVD